MVRQIDKQAAFHTTLEEKEKRILELERRLAEAETNLQALIAQQIDAVLLPENTIPLLLRQAQLALQRSNEELEERVNQRTSELLKELEERKLVEAALRDSEERFRQIVQLSPDTIFVQAGGKFQFINPAGVRMFGAEREEQILGNLVIDFMHPDDREAVSERIWVLNHQKQAVPLREEKMLRLDGSEIETEAAAVPILYSGQQGALVIARDISARKIMEKALHENLLNLEVQRRLNEYREKERQEIARELHDGPIQMLSGTIFHLQVAKESLEDPLLKLDLEQATINLKGTVRELRDTMNELRPPAIIRFGLAKSIKMYAEDFHEKNPQIDLTLNLFDDRDLLPEPNRLALFRIFQESLNNIVKHASARRVHVRLMKKGGEIQLQIHDNGRGFVVPKDLVLQTQNGHYGLAGMKERAEAIRGRFTVTSTPGKGTTTLVVVPLDQAPT